MGRRRTFVVVLVVAMLLAQFSFFLRPQLGGLLVLGGPIKAHRRDAENADSTRAPRRL